MSSKNVLFLGAGASKAYSASPTGLLMPIACDFFSTFEKLDIYHDPWVMRDALFDFVGRVKNLDPNIFFQNDIDIEDFYTEVEMYLNSHKGDRQIERIFAFKTYTQLVFIFAAVINTIQNGPLSSPHTLLAKKLASDDLVITFNWDTLLDRALQNLGTWTTDEGYNFFPKSIYRDGWEAPKLSQRAMPKLIKLHGSVNWLSSHPISPEEAIELTQESSPDTVWVYESTKSPYACHAGRFIDGFEDFSYGYYPPNILDDKGKSAPDGYLLVRARPGFISKGNASSSGLVSIPLIIPPVKEKNYHGFGVLFDDLWEEAGKGLVSAEHIIIIGYSFPKTDIKSNELFINAFMKRTDFPLVTILDPNPERIANKFKMEFGIPDSKLRVIKGYFSDETDVDYLFAFK